MRKTPFVLFCLTFILIGALIVINILSLSNNTNSNINLASTNKPDFVKAQLDSMTLDEKIAQMLIVTSPSPADADQELARLQTTPYGGYILMGESYGTLTDTRAMIEKYQQTARTPLIITTDEEGGLVQRLKNVKDLNPTDIPDMYSIGKTNDVSYAKTIGQILAEELRAVGINVDMAPVADVFSNPNNPVIGRRSFSENPATVTKMSQALAESLEENGVTATFKHFPGHGDTDIDSHDDLPIINRTREQLDASDLVPFVSAINNGAEFIMVGHIALPELTGDTTPASLSSKIITDLLRTELQYDNIIITDALNMGALTNNYPETDIYQKAIEAGADLLLMPVNHDLAIETIKQTIPESRIDESVYRILKFKQNQLANYEYLDLSYFGTPTHASTITK